jgi:hypothetical protein
VPVGQVADAGLDDVEAGEESGDLVAGAQLAAAQRAQQYLLQRAGLRALLADDHATYVENGDLLRPAGIIGGASARPLPWEARPSARRPPCRSSLLL